MKDLNKTIPPPPVTPQRSMEIHLQMMDENEKLKKWTKEAVQAFQFLRDHPSNDTEGRSEINSIMARYWNMGIK